MTASIVRFPQRRSSGIWVLQDEGAWLVLAGSSSSGWLHGDAAAAFADAAWLSQNFGLPISEDHTVTAEELLKAHNIHLPDTSPGRQYATCPQCSATRGKKNDKCLGVTIDAEGVCWGCNHCGWSGPPKGSGGKHELQAYVYRDADGVALFRKVRNLPGREPRFWLERADGRGGWLKGTKGVDTRIIYRLDEVKKAITEGRIIACAEGEKDADNLWATGIAATCNAHGASEPAKRAKWTPAHSEQLVNADLVVFNDNDAAGYEHADAMRVLIVRRLKFSATSIDNQNCATRCARVMRNSGAALRDIFRWR